MVQVPMEVAAGPGWVGVAGLLLPLAVGIAWWVPWAVSAGLSLFGKKKESDQQKKSQIPLPQAFQDFLSTGMLPTTAAPPLTTTGTSSSTTNSNDLETRDLVGTSMSAPFITPEYGALGGLVRQFAEQRLGAPSALPRSYVGMGLRNINQGFDAVNRALANRLSASGLAGSPAAVPAMARSEIARGAQAADFLGQIPMQERNLRNEDLAMASNLLAQFGRGTQGMTTDRGTIRRTGTSTTSGQTSSTETGRQQPTIDPAMWATLVQLLNSTPKGSSLWSSLSSLLGMLAGSGAFQGGGGKGGSFPSGVGAGAGAAGGALGL